MKKRVTALVLVFAIIVTIVPTMSIHAVSDFYFLLTYADIQANQTSLDQRYGQHSNSIVEPGQKLLSYSSGQNHYEVNDGYFVYLAQNEYEGFQVYYYEEGISRNIRIEVEPFVNSQGESLDFTVYKEEYFSSYGVIDEKLADALIPYNEENVQTVTNQNQMFYVDLHSTKNQTPGPYSSTVTLYIDDNYAKSEMITAVVWDFALPESHYSTVLAGLYNSTSSYGGTRGFLEANGINFDEEGEVIPEDVSKVETILERWQEVMLENGFTPYELPRYLIDQDQRKAIKTIADPKRKMFCVPVFAFGKYEGFLSEDTKKLVQTYKDLTDDSEYLHNKAFFYPADEVSWVNDEDSALFDKLMDEIVDLWPDYHSIVTYKNDGNFQYVMDKLHAKTDIACFNQDMFLGDTVTDEFLKNYLNSDWIKKLRFPGDIKSGSFRLYRSGKSSAGIYRRVFFWQQARLGDDGMLIWNCAYLPYTEAGLYKPWIDHILPPAKEKIDPYGHTISGVGGDNGDGLLLYPGVPFGLDPNEPVMSLRFKQIAAGLDDYDYLMLAKESLGEEEMVNAYKNLIGASEEGKLNNVGWFADDTCLWMNNARYELGEKLSGNVTHEFGDWESVVDAVVDDPGIEIHTCQKCGTVESRESNDAHVTTHSLTVSNGSGSGTYAANVAVPVQAEDQNSSGRDFLQWSGAEGLTFKKGDEKSAKGAIVMPDCDVNLTAIYEGENEEPVFKGHQLILSGQIGVKFGVVMPDNFSIGDSYMEFEVNGVREKVYAKDVLTDSKGRYFFTCMINSVQMADEITARFCWGEDKSVEQKYSVEEYITYIDDRSSDYDQETMNLVRALADYGHYVQPYLATANNWVVGEKHAEMTKYFTDSFDYESVKTAVSKYAPQKQTGDSKVTNVKYRLTLDSETGVSIRLSTSEDITLTAEGTLGNKTYQAERQSDGTYLVIVQGIPAGKLGETITVQGDADGAFNVTVSALSFVHTVLNKTEEEIEAKNAMSAFYYYHKASTEYANKV